jgi:hypothetical protein
VPFRHLDRLEADRSEERFGFGVKALPVLHRAGRVIGNAAMGHDWNTRTCIKAELRDDFGDVASERSDSRGLFGIGLVLAKHETIVFYCRTASRGIDHDGVQLASKPLPFPGLYAGARGGERCGLLPKVMGEGSAATGTRRRHDFTAVAVQQSDCRLVDFWS